MKYSSNHAVKFIQYEFEISVYKALLKTKFACQFYTSLKYRSDLPELISSESTAKNGEVLFNHTHRFPMIIQTKQDQQQPHHVTLSVGLRSKYRPLQKIIAGFVNLDISNYTKHNQPIKMFRIERCPDSQSIIELSIKSNKIREISENSSITQFNKLSLNKSQLSLTQTNQKQKLKPKLSVALNRSSMMKQSLKSQINISGSFSKFLNVKLKQQICTDRLLTPDREQNCQLSFAKLKQSEISKSLNYDQVKKSVEIFTQEFNTNEQIDNNLSKINKDLMKKLQQTQIQNKRKDAYIQLLEQELRNNKQKLESEKSTMLCQTIINNTILDKQLIFHNSGSTIEIQKQNELKYVGDIDIIERNKQLLKTLGELRQNIMLPIQQLQQILQDQTEQYDQASSWNALDILSTISEKLNIS